MAPQGEAVPHKADEHAPEAPDPQPASEPEIVPPAPARAGPEERVPATLVATPRSRKAPSASRRATRVPKTRPRRWLSAPRPPAVAAAFLLALVPASLLLREGVVRAVPGTASLFAAIGLPVNLVGLALENVSSSLGEEAGRPVLVVEGKVVNVAAIRKEAPALTIVIEDEDGAPLYTWSARGEASALEPGEAAPFRARLAAPPPAGRRVAVRFRSDKGAREVALR